MDTNLRSVRLVGFASALLCASGATAFAQAQPEPQSAATTTAQPPATPQPSADQPSAAQPPAAAPGSPPPAAFYPPPYYLPPGYAPPPGYYPPPGYAPPPCDCQALGSVPTGTPPGHHVHDGFYMRLTTGVGVLNTKDSLGGRDRTISGGGMAMSFAFGGALTPNLILYGELLTTAATDPRVDSAETSQNLGYDWNLTGIGPGVAYYLIPSNVYFSGTLAFSKVTESSTNNGSSNSRSVDITDMGIGASFMVGKEWWVSQNWGLGVAGYLHLASMKMKNDDTKMTASALGVLFSATFN